MNFANPTADVTILDGDHDTMTDKQLRGHYSIGCRHTHCRTAASTYRAAGQRERDEMKRNPDRRTIAPHSPASEEPAATAVEEATEARRDGVPREGSKPATSEHAPETSLAATPKPTPRPASTIAALGAVRRLQGLWHLGYEENELGRYLGWGSEQVLAFVTTPPIQLALPDHRRIIQTFKLLSVTPVLTTTKPGTDAYNRACASMTFADEQGWAGPFDWESIDTDTTPISRKPHRFDTVDWTKAGQAYEPKTGNQKSNAPENSELPSSEPALQEPGLELPDYITETIAVDVDEPPTDPVTDTIVEAVLELAGNQISEALDDQALAEAATARQAIEAFTETYAPPRLPDQDAHVLAENARLEQQNADLEREISALRETVTFLTPAADVAIERGREIDQLKALAFQLVDEHEQETNRLRDLVLHIAGDKLASSIEYSQRADDLARELHLERLKYTYLEAVSDQQQRELTELWHLAKPRTLRNALKRLSGRD